MSARPKYEYLWADGQNIKTPLKVSASEYIDFLMTWVESQLNNEIKGTVVAADCHYEYGKNSETMTNVRFLVPYQNKRKRSVDAVVDDESGLSSGRRNTTQKFEHSVLQSKALLGE